MRRRGNCRTQPEAKTELNDDDHYFDEHKLQLRGNAYSQMLEFSSGSTFLHSRRLNLSAIRDSQQPMPAAK